MDDVQCLKEEFRPTIGAPSGMVGRDSSVVEIKVLAKRLRGIAHDLEALSDHPWMLNAEAERGLHWLIEKARRSIN
jgi:hypothetical protein